MKLVKVPNMICINVRFVQMSDILQDYNVVCDVTLVYL